MIIDGKSEVQQKAASDANFVQDAVNLIAIVGSFHRHLLALRDDGHYGSNDLNNHPVSLAFVSKLVSLTNLTSDRESLAFQSLDQIEKGETVEYEVLP